MLNSNLSDIILYFVTFTLKSAKHKMTTKMLRKPHSFYSLLHIKTQFMVFANFLIDKFVIVSLERNYLDLTFKSAVFLCIYRYYKCTAKHVDDNMTYSTDFTKWDRFFISGWPALTLASPSLARAQARRDRRRIGCAQRMKWARAPTPFGPGKYTRPNPTWSCTQYTVWRLTWML